MANVNVTATIEPYRKGMPFGEWVERLEFYFALNKVSIETKRAYFVTLSGPVIFHELKLLFPTSNLNTVSYDDMIANLREKIIATWELAGKNAKKLSGTNDDQYGQIASLTQPLPKPGSTMQKLLAVYNAANVGTSGTRVSPRVPIKDRLGHRLYTRKFDDNVRPRGHYWRETEKFKPGGWRQKPNYADMTCNFCGVKGHIKRKCFKLKNMQQDAVNMVDQYQPGPSEDGRIADLLSRMRTEDSDSDE
ncbi:uncharacterized protein LOC135705805 [Ochlerotatus camptorhynchus]|uniref:uncharacterized protein LOC135705805 n=1 Tax=Ochlerotatus camptorhynchus TaxID=644619 RepID=UPI0031DF86F0